MSLSLTLPTTNGRREAYMMAGVPHVAPAVAWASIGPARRS
jgi:hypothetical protein